MAIAVLLSMLASVLSVVTLVLYFRLEKRLEEQSGELLRARRRLAEAERHVGIAPPVAAPLEPAIAAPMAAPTAAPPTAPPAAPPAPTMAAPPVAPAPPTPAPTQEYELVIEPAPPTQRPTAPGLDAAPPVSPPPVPPTAAAPLPPRPRIQPAPRPASAKVANELMELKLGARVFVVIGGIALALAGGFFVKYTWDVGLLTPEIRLSIGTLFGLALIIGGEVLKHRAGRVAEAMVGAGIADLYGVLIAAVRLHELVSPRVGFVLMAIVTGVAIAQSLRHGQWVALLGLLGGFIMPMIVGEKTESAAPIMGYLLLLEVGLMVVTRRRGWVGLSLLTLIGSMAWAAGYALFGPAETQGLTIGGFMLASAAAYVIGAAGRTQGMGREKSFGLALAAVASAAVLLGLLVATTTLDTTDLMLLSLLGAGAIALGRIDRRYLGIPALAAGVTAITLLASLIRAEFGEADLDDAFFVRVCLGFGALYAIGGYAAMWRSGREGMWAALSSAAAFGFFLLALVEMYGLWSDAARWSTALGIGVVLAIGAMPLWTRRIDTEYERALNAYTLGAAGFFTLASSLGLDHPWFASAWAGLAALAAVLFDRLRVNGLLVALAWLVGLAAAVLTVPGPFNLQVGPTPVLNILLPAYGLPTLAFALAAWRLHKAGQPTLSAILQVVAVIGLAATATLLIRRGFHPGWVSIEPVGIYEWATYASAYLTLALAVFGVNRRLEQATLDVCALLLAAGGVIVSLAGTGLGANPLWNTESVGPVPVLNGLLYIYGVPAFLTGAAAVWMRREGQEVLRGAFGGVALLLVFIMVSLMVRQAFVGPVLTLRLHAVTNAEWYSYSVAWVVLAFVLLIVGMWRDSVALRYGSLVVMLIAVGKVFLFDTAHLKDLWRVLSFLGLGLSLMVIGYVYQRWGLRRRLTPADEPTGVEAAA